MKRAILGFHRDRAEVQRLLENKGERWLREAIEQAKLIWLIETEKDALTTEEEEELAVLVYRAVFKRPVKEPKCSALMKWLAICRKRGS